MQKAIQKKVVRLNQSPLSTEVVERVLDKLKDGQITEFVIVARSKVPKEKQEEIGGYFTIDKYWFSSSSGIPVMGLLEYMKRDICDYINGDDDYYEE